MALRPPIVYKNRFLEIVTAVILFSMGYITELISVLRSKPEIDYCKEFGKIALISTFPLGFGDLVMDAPFMQSLRRAFPKAKITLITDKELFTKNSFLDAVIRMRGGYYELYKQFRRLRSKKYDLAIVMNRSYNQSLYMQGLAPRYVLGYYGNFKVLSNFKLRNTEKWTPRKDHYWDMALKIADALGIRRVETLPELNVTAEIKKKTGAILKAAGYSAKWNTIFVNTFAAWDSRRWKEENYVDLIERIHGVCDIFLFGSKGDVWLNDYIKKELKKRNVQVKDVTGKFNLLEAYYAISKASLFLTPDVGPMHFAFMSKTPTLALFGPINPEHRLPKKKSTIIKALWHLDHQRGGEYTYHYSYRDSSMNGMPGITVDMVEKEIRTFFRKGRFV
ncbi:MAG: glycosyltransferase family 9 protein [Nitrosarchaeum sp.]|nr:glycosyltransferase family 9 protein [Nitrosarchaeum sp.]